LKLRFAAQAGGRVEVQRAHIGFNSTKKQLPLTRQDLAFRVLKAEGESFFGGITPTMNWSKLKSSLEILVPGDPLPKPTDKELDDFEKKSGVRLSPNYRSYIKTFGSGYLGGTCNILAPFGDLKEYSQEVRQYLTQVDLELFNRHLREALGFGPERSQKVYKDWQRVSRMVYFANGIGGEVWGWDPEDVKEEDPVEYGVYFVSREEGDSHLVANSFTSFVEEVCFGGLLAGTFPEDPDELPQKTFEPTIMPDWFPRSEIW
jgi:hypothetical protein